MKQKTARDNNIPVSSFNFRMSARDPKDRRLSRLMAQDLQKGDVNLSAVIKGLLLVWYDQREATGEIDVHLYPIGGVQPLQQTTTMEESGEDPNDELVRVLSGTSFQDWE